ncbi:MAG: GNAT family N-acetyltransferase [Candidatus Hodarchaeota archaeon]
MKDENTQLKDIKAISLRRITRRNYRKIIGLKVKPEQKTLISSNAVSMADAYFYREAWMRAIYLGDIPIGFVMLGDNYLKYKFIKHFKPYLYIWRFMIADEYQRKGYGKKAMQRIIEYVKSKYNAKELIAYTLPKNKNALEFYKKLGFKPTGRKLPVGDLELLLEL